MEIKGYIQLHPDVIEDHQNKFKWKEKDGNILFPFTFQKTSDNDRCYLLIQHDEHEYQI
jgi:hypothetical protein